MIKTHKRKKPSRHHGMNMGTHGTGSRKNKRKSGHHGGAGMSGSGKRADHKKTLITKLYGNKYFGKQGVTSRGTKRDTRQRINLQQIEMNLGSYGKKTVKGYEVNLKNYKILGTGEVKNKLIIAAREASKSAIEKVKKAGGEIILPAVKVKPMGIYPKGHEPKSVALKDKKVLKVKEVVKKEGEADNKPSKKRVSKDGGL